MTNYQKRLSATAEQKSAAENAAAEVHSKLGIQSYIMSKQAGLATMDAALEAALAKSPLSVNELVGLKLEQTKLQTEAAVAQEILDEEFSEA